MFRTAPEGWFSPPPCPADVSWRLQYHGTAGFTVSSGQTNIVMDPFVTRPGLFSTAFQRLKPNTKRIEEVFPCADAVLVGHAHHDHILDAPHVCRSTGATFVGSQDAAYVAMAAGLPSDQICVTNGEKELQFGAATVRGIPSKHGKVYFGRTTLPGSIDEPPTWPPRVWDLRHGAVLNWHVELGGIRVVHIDSADVIEEELSGFRADVVCLCAIGRRYRPGYVDAVMRTLKPRWIVPCHWDWFFTPWGRSPKLLPGVDLQGFCREIETAGATPILLPFGGQFGLSHSTISE
jgi:L-ascorbate metabolism protein UlaG (beta-lactamase superfamily)